MRARKIIIEPFELLDLLCCDIHKKVNEHSTAQVIGTIDSEMEEAYTNNLLENINCKIIAKDNAQKSLLLFQGIVKSAKINYQNGLRTLHLDLVSMTFLMDQKPCDRTFQNAEMTYNDLLHFCEEDYPDFGLLMTRGAEETLGDVIVQYRETDWTFALRMASHFNTILLPACESELGGTRYYFGLPGRQDTIKIKPIEYIIHKALGEYVRKTVNEVEDLAERDAIYYETKDREIYFVGQKVVFKGRDLFVYEVNSTLEGQELVHRYILKEENGFKVTKKYNTKQVGISLPGRILEVRQDQVKVHVLVDESQNKDTAKWFAYSTVYSSPDGTGWYAMPEVGEEVRLYFPDEKEANAYIISATHTEEGEARENPAYKSLMTKYSKEARFTPNSLALTNNKGMYVEILDKEGINIVSNKKLTIRSDKSIIIASTQADLQMAAAKEIALIQGGAQSAAESGAGSMGGVSGGQENAQGSGAAVIGSAGVSSGQSGSGTGESYFDAPTDVSRPPGTENWTYPLSQRQKSIENNVRDGRNYGASRDGGTRRHAGVDLLTNSRDYYAWAMADGVVVSTIQNYWQGTSAVFVKHDSGLCALYAEIKIAAGLKANDRVIQGQVLGNTIPNTKNGDAMLHLEIYTCSERTSSNRFDPTFAQYLPAFIP